MNLEDFIREFSHITDKQIYAALGSAASDDSWGRNQGDRHDFIAFVWCEESAVSDRVLTTFEGYNWTDVQIHKIKAADLPLAMPEPPFVDAFNEALRGNVGLIIYGKSS